ncbi:uncharacterized protein LOC134836028 [Culicoides brevitarsis]|uniref:uncharacterized protein LOC134836028 n=1 Tax=Culicoides brevitarsis TaxID=469753 RepID=UPI00307C496C
MPPDKVESKHATVAASQHTAEDDSDMMMEPDEAHGEETRSFFDESEAETDFHPIFPSYTSISRTEHEPTEASDTAVTAEQNFFPYFRDSQPLGHSRPYYPTPEPPSAIRYNSFARTHDSLLGSGDFGVIKGGTFYQDSDPPIKNDPSDFYSFYNNGHGRPQAAPLIRKLTYPEEQFANFKDFADINTPNDPAYSQFVVVYANKNATAPVSHPNPKNIFEQLQLLDQEKAEKASKKSSKFKSKLAKTKLEKKYKKRTGPKESDYEPLLALS